MKYLFITLFAMVGCAGNEGLNSLETISDYAKSKSLSQRNGAQFSPSTSMVSDRKSKVIRTANVNIQVENIEKATRYFTSELEKLDGYISNSNQYNNNNRKNASLTIRVPKENLDVLIENCIKGGLFLENKSVNSNDVTEQYIDIETRLKNKKAVEKRYLELLNQAETLSDILAVEDKLRVIREEIESMQGRKNYYDSQIDMSTLNLNYYQIIEDYLPNPGKSFWSRVSESLKKGWYGFKSFVVFLFYLWPFYIAGGVIFIAIKKYRNKKKK